MVRSGIPVEDSGAVTVEVCVEGVEGLRVARAAGAARVELCCELSDGGITPSHGALAACVAEGGIEVHALVRPRGGDFLYSEPEFDVLERDVVAARALGVAGVAIGCLTDQGSIDVERVERLVAAARPLPVTFHRAFDLVRDPDAALETLVRLGCARVLTSGQAATAHDGRARIGELVRRARGRIAVIAAGGIRPENVREIVRDSGVRDVHLSASARRTSSMRYHNPHVRLGRGSAEYERWQTDEASLRDVIAALRG